jgi:V8-like Glu-specific endopeptidase
MGFGNCKSKEVDTGHADPIPESISNKIFDSIVKIKKDSIETATGFFMKIKINNKEKKCLFTCQHVISDKDINNKLTINLYYGKKDEEKEIKIILDKNKRFIKTFDEDVTLIEIINDDNISEKKYLTPDLNYEHGYDKYKDKNFYLAGYPKNYNERCISSGKIIGITEEEFEHQLNTSEGSSGSPI